MHIIRLVFEYTMQVVESQQTCIFNIVLYSTVQYCRYGSHDVDDFAVHLHLGLFIFSTPLYCISPQVESSTALCNITTNAWMHFWKSGELLFFV